MTMTSREHLIEGAAKILVGTRSREDWTASIPDAIDGVFSYNAHCPVWTTQKAKKYEPTYSNLGAKGLRTLHKNILNRAAQVARWYQNSTPNEFTESLLERLYGDEPVNEQAELSELAGLRDKSRREQGYP